MDQETVRALVREEVQAILAPLLDEVTEINRRVGDLEEALEEALDEAEGADSDPNATQPPRER